MPFYYKKSYVDIPVKCPLRCGHPDKIRVEEFPGGALFANICDFSPNSPECLRCVDDAIRQAKQLQNADHVFVPPQT